MGDRKDGQTGRRLLPPGCLPDPSIADVPARQRILDAQPLLSTCVENALGRLEKRTATPRRLSVEDVFVDVAKYGAGASVVRLRTYGVTPKMIDRLVGQLGWQIASRRE